MLTSHPSRILPQATPFATLGIALALAWAPACGQDPASADVAQDTQAQPANCDGGARCGAVEAGAEAGGPDTTAPVLSNGLPSGTLPGGTTAATLRVSTNEAATCRWSASPATAYASMTQTFATTGGTFHTTPLSGLAAGQSYDYYLRCQDAAGNVNTTDFVVSFRVASGTGAMSVSLVPSRASGVAPLAVFFDASGTIDSAVTSRPFHDLEYRWDFGDPGGSPVGGTTWVTGSGSGANSRNAALGPMAGHVFEVPGTYEVSLNVFDGSSAAGATTTITVSDPETTFAGANTVCVSMSGTFTGCPAGATHVTTGAFDTAVTDHAATNRRVLFRRGEVFTAGTSPVIAVDGPGILGAFGAGAKPVVRGPGTAPVVSLGTRGSGLYKDWRIMDLSLDGQNGHAGENVGIGAIGQFDQVTILRVDVTGTSTGFAASHWTLTAGQKSFDQWAIHDSSAKGVPDCNSPGNYICNWRIYVVGTRWSMQGNSLDNLGDPTTQHAGGSHVIRTEMLQSSVIGNNDIKGAGDFQLGIKLHAWAWGGGAGGNATANTYSERVLIADNKIEGGANPWLMSLGPQDEINDERVRDVLVERNWFRANQRTQAHMHINSSSTTIRNNLSDLTGAAYHTGVIVDQWGITPAPSAVHVYNNTFYNGGSGDFIGVQIGAAQGTAVQNNLACAPSASGPELISGSGTGLVQSNNLLCTSTAAVFVSATPAVPADFAPKALPNPARDTGLASVAFPSDLFGKNRPVSGAPDLGAIEGR